VRYRSNQFGIEIRNSSLHNSDPGTTEGENPTVISGNLISGNFVIGLVIFGETTSGVRVQGNWIGTTGDQDHKSSFMYDTNMNVTTGIIQQDGYDKRDTHVQDTGISILRAIGNTIGGMGDGDANVIAGNNVGIDIEGPLTGTDNSNSVTNMVTHNYIGITPSNDRIGNQFGIKIGNVPRNLIQDNVISDNLVGMSIFGDGATGNMVQGNSIGLVKMNSIGPGKRTRRGRATLFPIETPQKNGIPQVGIFIENASRNTIGAEGANGRNWISGNDVGVFILGKNGSASHNVIRRNSIGVLTDGKALGNRAYGILFYNAPNNTRLPNSIGRSGIAQYREFTGPVRAAKSATPAVMRLRGRGVTALASKTLHGSARPAGPRALAHARDARIAVPPWHEWLAPPQRHTDRIGPGGTPEQWPAATPWSGGITALGWLTKKKMLTSWSTWSE
jgi:hypothetical protein